MSKATIWTTEKVNEVLEKVRYGEELNASCFHERDYELRAENIIFQLTTEEEEEFIKCSEDIEYFVEKYCRFLTDEGRRTVELREFQGDILNTVGSEEWIPKIKDFGPKNRNFILMAARQTGKCLSFDTQIVIRFTSTKDSNKKDIKISIGELYNLVNKLYKSRKKTFKEKIISKTKTFLYNIYRKIDKQ